MVERVVIGERLREALAVGKVRFFILVLLFFATALDYIDRAALGFGSMVAARGHVHDPGRGLRPDDYGQQLWRALPLIPSTYWIVLVWMYLTSPRAVEGNR